MTPNITRPVRNKKPGRPLAQLPEIAEQLGITVAQIRGRMRRHPDHPKPINKIESNTAPFRSYYDPVLFKRWWKETS